METLDKDADIPREWPSAPVPECRAPFDKLTWTLPMQKKILVHELYGIKDDQGLGFS